MAVTRATLSEQPSAILQLAHTNAPARWQYDRRMIERVARGVLGLRWPIRISQTNGRGGRAKSGVHILEAGPAHRIGVARWLTPEQASRTLWHELTHARQAEQHGERAWRSRDRARGALRPSNTRYWHDPCEVEARDMEEEHERMALAR